VIVIVILLLATLTRLGQWQTDIRFYGDEALFARIARDAAVKGDWLISASLDKPPLALWGMALSMTLTGVTTDANGVLDLPIRAGERAARLPAVIYGVLTVAALMVAARRLGGDLASLWTGILAASSPTLTAFGATALTDPPMLLFLALAFWMALAGRGLWTGVMLALALMSKQQALLLIPLTGVLLWISVPREARWREGLRALLALLAGIVLLLLWDASRNAPSIFAVAADNNNPYRLLMPLSEWGGRLAQWLGLLAGGFGVLGFGVLIVASVGLIRRKHTVSALMVLALYAAGYVVSHVVLAFNVYDRYALPILLIVLVLAGVGLARLIPRRWTAPVLALLALSLLLTPPSLPLTERDTDSELIEMADFINQQGIGTIVYNRWLGWEMGYYLGAWSDKRVVYYPTPGALVEDAPRNPDRAPRLLIAPDWAEVNPWLTALDEAGFEVTRAYDSDNYAAWWLMPPPTETGE
jgi:4-amino-4-deoxy-L-arabinose transferase-like glycosyltransferase